MNIIKILAILLFTQSFLVNAAETGFLEGEAQEVLVKVRMPDGTLKWYKVANDGTRKEIEMKPGDRFEFLYEDSVDLDAITVNPDKNN
ncbi:MAG TPA: hypothetical protein ENJ08_04860 [Gammaproteobacteria bacterium]|nr:hypothetical protein [Gammaproteobacteria bacterium]